MHFWVICINMNVPYMCIQITYKSARALGNVMDLAKARVVSSPVLRLGTCQLRTRLQID